MKKFIGILILIASLVLCITACTPEQAATLSGNLTALSAPTNVRIENGMILWSFVPNANLYLVQIGDDSNQQTTTELSCPISSFRLEEGETYYAKVKALPGSASILYSESEWSGSSEAYTYQANTPQTNLVNKNNLNITTYGFVKNAEGNSVDVNIMSVLAVPNTNYTNDYISYKMGDKWYYIFDLGTLYNVQLEAGYKFPFQGVATTLTFQTSSTTSTSIQQYSEKATEDSSTSTTSWGVSANVTAGIPDKVSVSVGAHFDKTDTTSHTKTEKASSSYASSQANSESKSVSYSFTTDNAIGMYSYMLIGDVGVYQVVMYDTLSHRFYGDEISIIKSSNRALVYLGTFDSIYKNYSDTKLSFDPAIIDTLTEPTEERYASARETITLTPQNCDDNKGYDVTQPSTNAAAKAEVDPHLVDLYIEGCHKLDNGKYSIVDASDFSLGFVFTQGADAKNIGTVTTNNTAATILSIFTLGIPIFSSQKVTLYATLGEDAWTGTIKNTNITAPIKKGAYFYKVYYKDGSSDIGITESDFMNGHIATDDHRIATIDNINQDKELKRIVVSCVYEIQVYSSNIPIIPQRITNWRCDYTIEFE